MTLPVRRPATYDDIVALPEHVVGEIVGGELQVSPRPAIGHALGSSALGATLMPRFQFGDGGPGGWWILDEPELHFGEDVVVPDLAGWRKERMPELPRKTFLTATPDWVCEFLSPSTSRFDRTKKIPLYAHARIPHLCLFDTLAETLEVFRLESAHWVLLGAHGGDDVVRAEPFDAVALELKRIWGR
ncbi:MAG TPA: Uma2 family endonuclease [Polyangiaceae bacterium]